jgi:hypothetical protein
MSSVVAQIATADHEVMACFCEEASWSLSEWTHAAPLFFPLTSQRDKHFR